MTCVGPGAVASGPVFERFTEQARQSVVLAQDEARALKHNYIGTEHLLLGVMRVEEGVGARVLEVMDLTIEEVRAQVARIVGQGDEPVVDQIPFTPRAKKVLDLALREALRLGHNYIGTEHILLGLLREGEGVAARILLDFDADPDTVRHEVVQMLSGKAVRRQHLGTTGRAPYEPSAPTVPQHLVDELRATREEKERLIEEQRFEEAAAARERERPLVRAARQIEFGDREPRELSEWPRWSTAAFGTSIAATRPLDRLHLAAGAVVAAVGFPLGLLVGWLIWG